MLLLDRTRIFRGTFSSRVTQGRKFLIFIAVRDARQDRVRFILCSPRHPFLPYPPPSNCLRSLETTSKPAVSRTSPDVAQDIELYYCPDRLSAKRSRRQTNDKHEHCFVLNAKLTLYITEFVISILKRCNINYLITKISSKF